ncbi:S-layer homology domain-containing protein [Cohnella candidum]|nr:S-layer homology domain-containing protein [Cohnella candidum]
MRRIVSGALAALLWLMPLALLVEAASGSDIKDGTIERVDLAPAVRDRLAESAVLTVVKGLPFTETIPGLDFLESSYDSSGVTLSNIDSNDGYVQVAGMIAETGLQRIVLDGFPFLFDAVDPPTSGAVSYAISGSGGKEADKLVSNAGDAFKTVTLSVYAPDTSRHYRYRGVELAVFAETPGGSYTAMPGKQKRVITNRTTLEIDLASADDYEAGNTYRLGYRVLYSLVGAHGSEILAGDADNGKEGWRLLEDNGTLFSFTRSAAPALSSDATLSGLSVSEGNLTPAFSSGRKSYSVTVSESVYAVAVTPTVASGKATVTVDGKTVESGAAVDVSLKTDSSVTSIPITVTAEDGTTNEYSITVTRSATDTGSDPPPESSDNAAIAHLSVHPGALTPAFAPDVESYTVHVPYTATEMTIEALPFEPDASVTVNGKAKVDAVQLAVGETPISVEVIAPDGETRMTYRLVVTREGPPSTTNSNDRITVIPSKPGSLPLEFSTAVTERGGLSYLSVDPVKAAAAIDAAPQGTTTFLLSASAVSAGINIPAAVIDAAERKAGADASFVVATPTGTLRLPAGLLSKLADGNNGAAMTVTIRTSDDAAATQVRNAALSDGVRLISSPVQFELAVLDSEGVMHAVEDTNGIYVERTLQLESPAASVTQLSIFMLADDGRLAYVPATFERHSDGSVTAHAYRAGFSTYVAGSKEAAFGDLAGHWSAAAVHGLASKGIVSGRGPSRFQPDGIVTRAEFGSILARALGLQGNPSGPSYADISPTKWYYRDILALTQAGIMRGTNGLLLLDSPLTREEMAAMTARAIHYVKPSQSARQPDHLYAYRDAGAISGWAREAMQEMVSLGVMKGNGQGLLRPSSKATRAEAAVTVLQMLKTLGFADDPASK